MSRTKVAKLEPLRDIGNKERFFVKRFVCPSAGKLRENKMDYFGTCLELAKKLLYRRKGLLWSMGSEYPYYCGRCAVNYVIANKVS